MKRSLSGFREDAVKIPSLILKQLYTHGSLESDSTGVSFGLKNRLSDATHGGGTALATQRECLELLGCRGRGKVKKLAEIVAGVALAGEISLGAAISSLDWVSSHEKYGRNR